MPPTGLWDGTIQSRAGEVHFNIELKQQPGGALEATLINATDRQPFSNAEWQGGTLTLRMNYYDGVLTLHSIAPGSMEGEYSRLTSKGMVHIPVALAPHQHEKSEQGKPWTGLSLAGDWIFTWPSESGAEKTTRASFTQQKNTGGTVSR